MRAPGNGHADGGRLEPDRDFEARPAGGGDEGYGRRGGPGRRDDLEQGGPAVQPVEMHDDLPARHQDAGLARPVQALGRAAPIARRAVQAQAARGDRSRGQTDRAHQDRGREERASRGGGGVGLGYGHALATISSCTRTPAVSVLCTGHFFAISPSRASWAGSRSPLTVMRRVIWSTIARGSSQ